MACCRSEPVADIETSIAIREHQKCTTNQIDSAPIAPCVDLELRSPQRVREPQQFLQGQIILYQASTQESRRQQEGSMLSLGPAPQALPSLFDKRSEFRRFAHSRSRQSDD